MKKVCEYDLYAKLEKCNFNDKASGILGIHYLHKGDSMDPMSLRTVQD